MRELAFLVPGDPDSRTGGYAYNRRIAAGLEALGWNVRRCRLGEDFPAPTAAAFEDAERTLASLPYGRLTLIDGLAFGAMPKLMARHARRLELVALVHHPLADETGLEPDRARQLAASERAALAHASGAIVTSSFTATQVGAMGVPAARVHVVEPGVDPAPLAPLRGTPPFQLLCIASLVPRKGHRFLVQALAAIGGDDWRLTLVGSEARCPRTTRQLRAAIAGHRLEQQVRLLGELDDAGCHDAYQQADLFVLPSLHEGYGMVLTEALAHGLPSLSTRAGAIPQTLPADCCVLVEPAQAGPLARALQRVLREPGVYRQLAAAARRRRDRLTPWPTAAERFSAALLAVSASCREAVP